MAKGLRRTAFDSAAYEFWSNQYGVVNARDFGTDGAAIQAAADVLQNGQTLYIPNGTWVCLKEIILPDNLTSVKVVGGGTQTILVAATPGMSSVMSASGITQSIFSNLYFNVNGNASYGLSLVQSPETSTQNVLQFIRGQNAVSYLINLIGQEDTVLIHCANEGAEGTSTIPGALNWDIPDGAGTIIGGALFGGCQIAAQAMQITGATIGPLISNNPNAISSWIWNLDGCYIYDGVGTGLAPITTSNNLPNINLNGCYLVSQVSPVWINGNIPSGALIRATNCMWIQGSTNSHTSATICSASGVGVLEIHGGQIVLTGKGTSSSVLLRVGTSTTIVRVPLPIAGLTETNPGAMSLAGPTAGTITWVQHEIGTAKKFIAVAEDYENDTTTAQSITFPVAFSNTPAITTNTSGLTISATTSALTISAPDNTTAYSGVIIIEGI